MLDIKLIREKPDLVKAGLKNRGGRSLPDFEAAINKDKEWRGVLTELESLRARRNKSADEIGRLKKEKKDASKLLASMEALKKDYKELEEKERDVKLQTEALLLGLPNVPDASVPVGASADKNKVVREGGAKPRFSFKPKDHHDLGTQLGLLHLETAAKLSGARFSILSGAGAKLERAIANFMVDLHTSEHGYREVLPPFLVSKETMTGTGQLPKFADELYKCADDDLYLIPTSEVSLANLYRDLVLDESDLPMAVTALTPCFRREAGSYGKDTRGLIRNHQFDKVELVRVCRLEDSLSELENLTSHAEEVLKRLGIPYRVVALCTGDMGFAASKTYDLEVWMPGESAWREISSCSTCGDFQARRINFKVTKDKKREFGCTLNGSGLAVGRTLAAVLENYQDTDGSVRVPAALQKYMGIDKITEEKAPF